MEEERILKAQRIKRAIQMYKKACNEMYKSGLFYRVEYHHQVLSDKLDLLAKLFNLKIQNLDNDGVIFIDGFKIFTYEYFKEQKYLSWSDREIQQQLKEFFFDTGNKEKAFEKMLQVEKQKCKEDYVRERCSWSKKFKTLQEFEKHINRKLSKTYEEIINEYLAYRNQWEKLNDDTEMDDYYYPLTFKRWYESNY